MLYVRPYRPFIACKNDRHRLDVASNHLCFAIRSNMLSCCIQILWLHKKGVGSVVSTLIPVILQTSDRGIVGNSESPLKSVHVVPM